MGKQEGYLLIEGFGKDSLHFTAEEKVWVCVRVCVGEEERERGAGGLEIFIT